ncbi:signal peptide peptidase-like 2B [Trichonephila clavata]|uniref:Signal peptide peptidase-like 2B n=1 Tax=Trichonephila clavata TaxID=2740835 RepID=A0A8X6LNW4_TRICU|nr:signal peptide peptidase-like 2B [Trichonephila clavata]
MSFYSSLRKCIIYLTFFNVFNLCTAYEYAVLAADSDTRNDQFCLYVDQPHYIYPEQKSMSEPYILQNDDEIDWCMNTSTIDSANKVLLLPAGNCSITAQVHNFFRMGGKVIIFVNNGSLDNMTFDERTDLNETGIPVVKISEHSGKMLKEMGRTVTVYLFQPDGLGFGYFIAVTWSFSMLTIILSSYWSGFISYEIFSKSSFLKPTPNMTRTTVISRAGVKASRTKTTEFRGRAATTKTTSIEAATRKPPFLELCCNTMMDKTGMHLITNGDGATIVFTPCHVIFCITLSTCGFVVAYFVKDYLTRVYNYIYLFVCAVALYECLSYILRKCRHQSVKKWVLA